MVVSLNLNSLSRKLKNLSEQSETDVKLPSGVSREDYDLLMRVLKAREPAEIEDISADKIAEMFSYAVNVLEGFNTEPYLTERLFSKLSGFSSVQKRRCL